MIHQGITFQEYLALPGFNSSLLKPYSKSARYGYYKEQKGFTQSQAMNIGTLAHGLILEGPEALERIICEDYITSGWPVNPSTNKPYGETSSKWKEWVSTVDKRVMLPDELAQVKAMAQAVAEHPMAMQLLSRCDKREFAVTWTCEYTGQLMKALIDAAGSGIALDLKTLGKRLNTGTLEREMYDRQYHMQFSMYADGLHMNGMDTEFFAIFVQSKEEMDVCCAEINYTALEQGRTDYCRAIENHALAREVQAKPGMFPHIIDLSIPYYAIEEFQENADFVNEVKG